MSHPYDITDHVSRRGRNVKIQERNDLLVCDQFYLDVNPNDAQVYEQFTTDNPKGCDMMKNEAYSPSFVQEVNDDACGNNLDNKQPVLYFSESEFSKIQPTNVLPDMNQLFQETYDSKSGVQSEVRKEKENDVWSTLTLESRVSLLKEQIRIFEEPSTSLTVQYLRSWIPRFYCVYYGEHTALLKKAKVEWAIPSDWPRDIPFGDPNNSKAKDEHKFKKPDLLLMFAHLVLVFKRNFMSESQNDGISMPTDISEVLSLVETLPSDINLPPPMKTSSLTSLEANRLLWSVEARLEKKLNIIKPMVRETNWEVLKMCFDAITTLLENNIQGAKMAAYELETTITNFYTSESQKPEEERLNIDNWKYFGVKETTAEPVLNSMELAASSNFVSMETTLKSEQENDSFLENLISGDQCTPQIPILDEAWSIVFND